MSVIPLFKSHYSVGKSILTLEKAAEITDSSPISIFSIAKTHNLKEITLVEDSISGFIQAYSYAKDMGIKLIFGLRVTIIEDITDKSEASLKKESKIIIFPKNNAGYKKLIKLSTIASSTGFYYVPRLDYSTLKEYYDDNLMIAIPFYDSFLFNNSLYGHLCVPDFSFFKPIFFIEENSLPFDHIILDKVNSYTKGKFEIQKTQSVFYYEREDFLAYLTFRCINNRTNLNKPNLEHMSSDTFCFESYLNSK